MEMSAGIYFKDRTKDKALLKEIKDRAESDYDLSVDDEQVKGDMCMVELFGGSSTDSDVKALMILLHEKGSDLVKGYVSGDEEPECELSTVVNGSISSVMLSSSLYEIIWEAEEDDEEISDPDVKEAMDKGTTNYFMNRYNAWKKGLESMNLENISDIIDYGGDEEE